MTLFDLHQADALSYLRENVADESIDTICTDPPYDSLEKHRKVGTTTRLTNSKASSNVWFPTMPPAVLIEHAIEWLRVLKTGRHLYVFCDPETSYDIVPEMKAAGWVWGNRIIWNKDAMGMGYHYRRSYEDILFFTKKPRGKIKKRPLRDLSILDMITCKRLKGKKEDGEAYYPTEKPVPIIKTILHQSTESGELVLDPFMGSGSTGEAALSLGCRFLGIDIGDESIRRTRERLGAFETSHEPLAGVPAQQAQSELLKPPWGREYP